MSSLSRFSDYVLFEKLTTTAFGNCYRAGKILGNVIDSHVLLQTFDGSSLDGESFWQLVADRRSLVENLKDPHLAESIAFDRDGSTAFTAYTYAPGRSLDVFLTAVRDQNMPVPVDQALFIIERAALGLTAAHQVTHRGRPVLHGFLVPELIRLSSEGEIRVLGIEAAPGLRNQLANHPAFIFYLAPEVRAGEAPTETDDVFSLGALLFHLLCGQPLPPDSADSPAEVIDSARMAAGEEPLPPVIANLLKNSLAPRANRIPNSVTWQQVLGTIILDGEHNPTTFNLSFLMHTIFRRELEAELAQIPQELALRPAPAEPSIEVIEAEEPDHEETAAVAALPGLPFEKPPKPFLTGFVVSFLGAAIIIGAYFLFFHSPGEADTGSLQPPAAAVVEAVPTDLAVPSTADGLTPDPETVPIQDEPGGEISAAVPAEATENSSADETEAQLEELLASRTEDLETTLRAEYEARIRQLESQLAATDEPSDTEAPDAAADAALVESRVLTEIAARSEQGAETSEITDTALAAETEIGSLDEATSSGSSPAATSGVAIPDADSPAVVPQNPPRKTDDVTQAVERPEIQASADDQQVSDSPVVDAIPMIFQPPRLESPPRPKYPAAARRLRKSATVQVRVLVDSSGRVSKTELPGPTAGFGFDSAAEAAAKRSRWTPATRNGVPVDSWAVLSIEFQP